MARLPSSPDDGDEYAEIDLTVWRRFRNALQREDSRLLDGGEIERELRGQVRRIIRRTLDRLGAPGDAATSPTGAAIGEHRAEQSIHPSASLAAADVLFATTLPVLVERQARDADDHSSPVELATALHESITEVVVPASVEYVDVLLDRLSVAHGEERRRISHDLHDSVAQSIAAARHRVELLGGTQDAVGDPDHADPVGSILALLDAGLAETRAIAADLRQSVGERTLCEALTDWAGTLVGGPNCVIAETGVAGRLTASSRDEAFMVVRELIRNARNHADATQIDVRIRWLPAIAELTVTDDGRGFRADRIRPGAMGLVTARERSEIIGGDLRIDSEPDAGTRAMLTVPVRAA